MVEPDPCKASKEQQQPSKIVKLSELIDFGHTTGGNQSLVWCYRKLGYHNQEEQIQGAMQSKPHQPFRGYHPSNQPWSDKPRKRGGRKHRNKGMKYSKANHEVDIFLGNITSWSAHACHYISTAPHAVALVAEAHLLKPQLIRELKHLSKCNWAGSGAATIATEADGTSAGCLALVKKHWFSKPLTTCSDGSGLVNQGSRLAGRTIKIQGVEILVLAGYFQCGGDLDSPTNKNILQEIEDLTRGGEAPFILGADVNFSEDKWAKAVIPWLRKLQAITVLPNDSSYTCKGAEGARDTLIDYFVVSVALRPLILKCNVVLDVPWGPHLGVILTLSTRIDKILA